MKCLSCDKQFYGKTIQSYINHLKNHKTLTRFKCEHCDHIYDNIYDFKKHLLKELKSDYIPDQIRQEISCSDKNINQNDELNENIGDINIFNNTQSYQLLKNKIIDPVKQFEQQLINDLLINLSDISMTRSKAFDVYKTSIIRQKEILQLIVNAAGMNDQVSNFIKSLDNMLEQITFSEYTLINFLKRNNLWIETVNLTLAQETILLSNTLTKTNKYSIEYVGINNVLSMLLNVPEIRNIFADFFSSRSRNSDYISHVLESNSFREILLEEEKCNPHYEQTIYVPYSLYSDEFDPKNSLGSHGSSYAVGHVYLFLHCFPPEYASKLEFIFFIMSYFSGDKKKYGTNNIFNTLANEISAIENKVFEIDHEKYKYVQFKFINLMGDNKDLHELLGFTGYFLADILCRFCYSPKIIRSTQTIEIDSFMRNQKKYEEDVTELNVKKSGISKKSPFNGVSKKFGIVNNPFVDIMHDVILGAFKYDISYALFELCCSKKNKILNLDILNEKIHSTAYGPNYRNIIDTITPERLKSGNIKGSASELMNLMLHLPIILESLNVDPENQFFKLIVSCKKVLTLLLQQEIHKNFHVLLKHEISQHLNLVLDILIPLGYSLKYKHHLLVHYFRILERIGPLISFACFRGEAKHLKFKKCAQSIPGCQNLISTFAKRNQFLFAAFLNKSSYDVPLIETFSFSNITEIDLRIKYSINLPFTLIKVYKKISYSGTIYSIDDIIFISSENAYGQIKEIISDDTDYYFIYENLDIMYLDYIDAYEILNYTHAFNFTKIEKNFAATKPLKLFKINDRSIFNSM